MSAMEHIPNQDNGLLRFMTCGSVDDGKSTLIGRLLYDTKTILADALSAIEKTSKGRYSKVRCSSTKLAQSYQGSSGSFS